MLTPPCMPRPTHPSLFPVRLPPGEPVIRPAAGRAPPVGLAFRRLDAQVRTVRSVFRLKGCKYFRHSNRTLPSSAISVHADFIASHKDTVCKRSVGELWFSARILPVGSASFHPRPSLRGVPDLDKGRLLRPLVVIHGKVFPDTSRKHLSWLKSSNFCSCIALQNKNLPPCCYFLLLAFVQTFKKCNLCFP